MDNCSQDINQIQNLLIIPSLDSEVVSRLCHNKGLWPIESNLGYIYFKGRNGEIIGTSNVNYLVRKPKNNSELTKQETAFLKDFNLL